MAVMSMSSWGGLSHEPHDVVALADRSQSIVEVASKRLPGLPRGCGRSYGDVCLNPSGILWSTRGLDRFISFDHDSGVVECEAGVTLARLIELVLPHGWFLPVTPGTRFVTVGGALANDVHGKNHHRFGTFAEHVESVTLLRTDGSSIVCGPHENEAWFRATAGGLGLTGLISTLRLRLRRVAGPWIETTTTSFDSLDRFFELSAEASTRSEYTVSWVDGRAPAGGRRPGVFFAGEHSASTEPLPRARVRTMPWSPSFSLVNPYSVAAFNKLYYRRHAGGIGTARRSYRDFFYPLDKLLEWNRIYGRRGFFQYQCVVPRAVERDATAELLAVVAASGSASFLAVLKTFGERAPLGLLSFPMPGTTLALDFPNRGDATLALFARLDAVVAAAGGRLYPAKDATMTATLFRQGFPRWTEFEAFRDPGISSQMSRRLFGR